MNIATWNARAAWHPFGESLEKGFTLVELIIVIVLLSVISIYAAPRLFKSADFTATGFHDETLSFLRFARQTAVAQRRTVCVAFTPNSLTLSIASTSNIAICDTSLRGPKGETPATLTAIASSSFSSQPTDFNFDALGRPLSKSGGTATTQSIQIHGATKPVIIEAETGFVHE